jgi:hypothetical protein
MRDSPKLIYIYRKGGRIIRDEFLEAAVGSEVTRERMRGPKRM